MPNSVVRDALVTDVLPLNVTVPLIVTPSLRRTRALLVERSMSVLSVTPRRRLLLNQPPLLSLDWLEVGSLHRS